MHAILKVIPFGEKGLAHLFRHCSNCKHICDAIYLHEALYFPNTFTMAQSLRYHDALLFFFIFLFGRAKKEKILKWNWVIRSSWIKYIKIKIANGFIRVAKRNCSEPLKFKIGNKPNGFCLTELQAAKWIETIKMTILPQRIKCNSKQMLCCTFFLLWFY